MIYFDHNATTPLLPAARRAWLDAAERFIGNPSSPHRLGARAGRRRDGGWSLSGLLRPDEAEDLTGIDLPEHDDYDTLAGLVLQVLGRVPQVGDVAEVDLPVAADERDDEDGAARRVAVLRVDRMDGLRIDRVSLTLHERSATTEGEQP